MNNDNRNSNPDGFNNEEPILNNQTTRGNENINNPIISDENEISQQSEGQEALDKARTNPINADDVDGIVSERTTGSDPNDIAGVSDLNATLSRGSRYSRRNS